MGTLSSPAVGGTVDSPGAVSVGVIGTQSGRSLTVWAQAYCISITEGGAGNGINMNTEQIRTLADLLVKAADVVEGKTD
jgi:hypothetical protein